MGVQTHPFWELLHSDTRKAILSSEKTQVRSSWAQKNQYEELLGVTTAIEGSVGLNPGIKGALGSKNRYFGSFGSQKQGFRELLG